MKPLLLFSRGDDDADFLYACHFPVEQALYVRFEEGDDLLVLPGMEVGRAQRQARAARIVDRVELGWRDDPDLPGQWLELAGRVLAERAVRAVRVSPRLPALLYEGLRQLGLEVEIDRDLFVRERRRKSAEEVDAIRAAQQAAEAACCEVIALLAAARPRSDGWLWLEDSPLTSERLMARAQATLSEIGYVAQEMIVAGAPDCALPHLRGSGPIRADAPVVIDIFPRGSTSRYHGDLTRTVVVGRIPDEIRRMHEACVAAMDEAISRLTDGVDGREVHRAVCRTLVEHGYGTSTPGFEGRAEGPIMNHSTGHGVGLEVHEPPTLGRVDCPLRAGDVVTVEPGLYLSGLGGVRVEDTGLITRKGFQDFTTLPRSLDPADYL
ncbi:MAG TPA: Xaa-Pro peptidase family protein [Candidatus Dormibacteraeota bacterium]|nr:Xaa-Pro peptidase family protein [Candidatus Dormibacteraeota bacterium]